MDTNTLIAATTVILGNALSIGGEEIVKGIGKDIYSLIKKKYSSEGDDEIVQNLGSLSATSVRDFQKSLNEKLELDVDFKIELSNYFDLSSTELFKVERIVELIQNLRVDINDLYEGLENSGPATEGDFRNRIFLQSKKLKKAEIELMDIFESK